MNASNTMVKRSTLPSSMYYGLKSNPLPPVDLRGPKPGGHQVDVEAPASMGEVHAAVALGGARGALHPKSSQLFWLVAILATAFWINKGQRRKSK